MSARLITSQGDVMDLAAAASGTAASLAEAGVRPSDRVLLCADNSPGYVAVLLALMHLDASLVLLDHRQTPAETSAVARRTGVTWTVTDTAIAEPEERAYRHHSLLIGDLVRAKAAPDVRISLDDWRKRSDALITWSSGSTGVPKGIVRTGAAFLDNLERTRRRMEYRPEDVLMPLLPFSHQWGLSLILLAWTSGATLVVVPYARLDQVLPTAGQAGVTTVDATPATYHTLLSVIARRPELRSAIASVRRWCTGGAPLHSGLAERFRETLGLPLLDGYGSTEAGNVTFAVPDDPVACGRPLDGVDVWVAGTNGRPTEPGETGEIWLRSPDLFSGYLEDDGEVSAVDHRDGYRTGDIGFFDDFGHLHVLGRKSAVHRSGHTLYPDVIERTAQRCGRPVKIVPLDDERRGTRLVFVVADPDRGAASMWRQRISALLPEYERPNKVLVIDELPLNRTGKVDGQALKGMVLRHLDGAYPGAESGPGANGESASAFSTTSGKHIRQA